MKTEGKLNKLKQIIKNMGSVLIAYSGGVDSTFLLKVAKEEMKKFNRSNLFHRIAKRLKSLGYTHVTVDLEGYRTGSMNEVLRKPAAV